MRRVVCVCCLVIALSATRAAAQITVTAPSGGANAVASANDFATQVFQDPWDMNQRSDLGWWLNSVDYPQHGFSSFNFSGGLFSGTIAADPNVWLLETNFPNLSTVGKNGAAFPINADVYRVVAIRMRDPGRRPVHARSTGPPTRCTTRRACRSRTSSRRRPVGASTSSTWRRLDF